MSGGEGFVRWSVAMSDALYGPDGFYRRGEAPAEHFRTSVHASTQFAAALCRLVMLVDDLLGRPAVLDIVDVGAGRGELLCQLRDALPVEVAGRVNLVGVEVRTKPSQLDEAITWQVEIPQDIVGVLIANEWLDNIPVDVVRNDGLHGQLRYVMIDPRSGREETGPVPSQADRQWLDRWWPLSDSNSDDVAEVGTRRDTEWGKAIAALDRGIAIAMDYSHSRRDREAGVFASGTIAGFRDGYLVPATPDGSCDITAHVALDSCLAAGESSGATESVLTTQRAALQSLGVDASRPPIAQATSDPAGYVQSLSRASEAGELIDSTGLGTFGWLVQTKGMAMPFVLGELGFTDPIPRPTSGPALPSP